MGDGRGATYGLYVFSDSTWIRVLLPLSGARNIDRDAQGRIWVIASSDIVYRIAGNTVTEYSGFRDLGVGSLSTFAAGSGDTVWMGGYSVVRREANPALFLRFDGREWRRFSGADGLPGSSSIDAMAVDSTGTVWGKPVYDEPDYLAGRSRFYPTLVSYDGREWRGYEILLKGFAYGEVGMVVDPGGTLWVSDSYLLAHKTASGWMSYEYVKAGGKGRRSMAAERAGRIWIQGGGLDRRVRVRPILPHTIGSNPDVFGSPVYRCPPEAVLRRGGAVDSR